MNARQNFHLDWIDALKAFAIFGILLVHIVEAMGYSTIFFYPRADWPSFSGRVAGIFPDAGNFFYNLVIFSGWLGNFAPGIFILLSGLTLTLSELKKQSAPIDFYKQRAIRIYPLYITIHIVVLLFAILVFNWAVNPFGIRNLLSLAGIRFIDQTFFHLNPSWWFIGLILQLYFLFPLLLKLLRKTGIAPFILITLAITVLSRGAGLLDITYSRSLLRWMMGLFAGTRLAEFTFGMALGYMFFHNNPKLKTLFDHPYRTGLVSAVVTFTGFFMGLTHIGSLFSYLLLTMGFSGIFYSGYVLIFKQSAATRSATIWLGRNSFSVFLLHQPFMIFAASRLEGIQLVSAMILICILSFVAGYYLESAVNNLFPPILNRIQILYNRLQMKTTFYHILVLIIPLSILFFFIPVLDISHNLIKGRIILILVVLAAIFIYREKQDFRMDYIRSRFLDLVFIMSAVFFGLPAKWYPFFGPVILLVLVLAALTIGLKYYYSYFISIITVFSLILGIERYLAVTRPVDVSLWGELPALKVDEQTGYSLIPGKRTRMKYENYDYYLLTNSLGMASPEISLERDPGEFRIFIVGDAFSMPEGVEYQYSYPYLLEKELQKRLPDKKITVVNGGVTGFGPNEFLAQIKKYADTVKPDLIINQFFVNEFLEINSELHSRNRGIGFFMIDQKYHYYLSNRQLPEHFRRRMRSVFARDMDLIAWKSLLRFYEKDSPLYHDSVLVKIDNYFEEVRSLSAEKGWELLVMFVPGQITVSAPEHMVYFPWHLDLSDTSAFDFERPNLLISSMCREKGIHFLDVTNQMRQHPVQPLYYPESWHWNAEGHKVVAKVLAERVLEN
jgi:peptidoglycan/LPS O-acetylase OafA/YrhL